MLAGAGAVEPVKIGFFMSITGRDASFGEVSVRVARGWRWTSSTPPAACWAGRSSWSSRTTARIAGESATAAKKLITRDRVAVLIGECSSARTLEAAPIAQAAGIPLITPAATNPKVTQAGDAIFRVCFIDPFQGDVIAAFARQRLGLKRAALLVEAGAPYSVGLAEYFEKDVQGPRRRDRDRCRSIPGADTDFRAQLTAIRAAQARRPLPARLLCRRGTRRPAGEGTRAHGDAARRRRLRGASAAGDRRRRDGRRLLFNTLRHGKHRRGLARVRRGLHQSATAPRPNGLSALTYDAVKLAADAMRRAGTTEPKALRAALAATKDFPGVTGRTTINARATPTRKPPSSR